MLAEVASSGSCLMQDSRQLGFFFGSSGTCPQWPPPQKQTCIRFIPIRSSLRVGVFSVLRVLVSFCFPCGFTGRVFHSVFRILSVFLQRAGLDRLNFGSSDVGSSIRELTVTTCAFKQEYTPTTKLHCLVLTLPPAPRLMSLSSVAPFSLTSSLIPPAQIITTCPTIKRAQAVVV